MTVEAGRQRTRKTKAFEKICFPGTIANELKEDLKLAINLIKNMIIR